MGNIVAGTVGQSRVEFYQCVAHDEILGLDGHGEGENEHLLVREEHGESQQDTVDRARSPHRRGKNAVVHDTRVYRMEKREELDKFLYQARAHTAHHVINKEAAPAPDGLQNPAEHPQGEHIEEDVRETPVHKQVRDRLPDVEIAHTEEKQAEEPGQVYPPPRENLGGEEEKHIDDQEIFGNRRSAVHAV